MSPPLLQLTGIGKSFGAVRALGSVSFDLAAGEVHALLGENGAGKSTLIKIITGAHPPDRGTIEVDGRRLERITPTLARQHGIACIYQQPALFPDLTVEENIDLRLQGGSPWRRLDRKTRRTRARRLLDQIGAEIQPEAEVRELSMPEQQLVEVACALGAEARIVIMDEPTASLTRQEQELLFGVVRRLREAGMGVIYISHRMEEIFALADRVTVLRDGESMGTMRLDQTDETALIRLMVGREISHLYPEKEGEVGQVRLSASGLGHRASGVRGASLELRAGEVLGLAGLVGSGRTELARILFGLSPADEGEIRIDGQACALNSPQDAIRRGIAYVPEDRRRHGVVLEMSVAENTTMAVQDRLFPWGWLRLGAERTETLAAMRELAVKAEGPEAAAGSLSGGNQQKVALARGLATRPKVLILDEPTQGVDVGAKGEIHRIIRRLAREGAAVLMISSDLPEILGMSDRIAVMRHGTIVGELSGAATADEVMAAALGQRGRTEAA